MTSLADALRKLFDELVDAINLVSSKSKDDHNWPTTTAVEKLDRHLTMEYPFRRDAAAWPPFTGVRVPLGG